MLWGYSVQNVFDSFLKSLHLIVGEAVQRYSQQRLLCDRNTSHPVYAKPARKHCDHRSTGWRNSMCVGPLNVSLHFKTELTFHVLSVRNLRCKKRIQARELLWVILESGNFAVCHLGPNAHLKPPKDPSLTSAINGCILRE